MTVINVLAAMVVFIYVTPLLNAVDGIHGATVALLLLVYGIAAMAGNTWGGHASDRFGAVPTLFALLLTLQLGRRHVEAEKVPVRVGRAAAAE